MTSKAEPEPEHPDTTDEPQDRLNALPCGYGDQDENGVDVSLLRENLKLTPTQRWDKHQRALALALEVRRAGQAARLRQRTNRA